MDEKTTFQEMYDFFLAGITDDMFIELNEEDTELLLQEIFMAALPHFAFPRKDIFDLDLENKVCNYSLSLEEKLIIRQYMIVEWIGYQLASIENIRQKYSGSDFKFTSQAAHIDKLIKMRQEYEHHGKHLQSVYNRRKWDDENRQFASTYDVLATRKSNGRGLGGE